MFRSTTIIRKRVLNLAKVIFVLKHSVTLRHYMCVLCALHTTHMPLRDMLPHHQ